MWESSEKESERDAQIFAAVAQWFYVNNIYHVKKNRFIDRNVLDVFRTNSCSYNDVT